jgi:STE24 endopeptidase
VATILLYLILAFILLEFIFSKVLENLNLKTWDKPLPAEVKDLYSPEKYKEARDYAFENNKVASVSGAISLVVSLSFLYFGGFAWADGLVRMYTDNAIIQGLFFFGVLGLGSSIISLPFELYSTFVIEEKYGFNKTTVSTFIADKIKGLLMGIVIGGGLYALLAWLFQQLGNHFWWTAWIVVTVVSVFFAMFYTSWILPLFNKLTPLEEGELRTAIEKYAAKVNFPLTNVFVMDGSKRSTKANAFFSGLGTKKNIVLYDTLVNEMTIDEITAVLAHEVGHYKKKHIYQSMVLSVFQMGVLFFVFGMLAKSPLMASVLGAKENSFYLALVTFSLLYSPISLVTGLLMNLFSRKNEYEADAYARDTYDAEPLMTSLKKMSVHHLSNLQPHPAYVFVHYSHPTLLQRMKAVED